MKNTSVRLERNHGITILLVVLVLSALLSIGVGIFGVIYGQIRISGDLTDSRKALYAADQGIERMLYLDFVAHTVNSGYAENNVPTAGGGCFSSTLTRSATETFVSTVGTFSCSPSASRFTKRAIDVHYPNP